MSSGSRLGLLLRLLAAAALALLTLALLSFSPPAAGAKGPKLERTKLCPPGSSKVFCGKEEIEKGSKGPGGSGSSGGSGGGGGGGGSGPGGGSGGTSSGDNDTPSASPAGIGSQNPLGLENPLCDSSLRPGQERNCNKTGSPEARFPTSHYGLEIHIDTGLDNIDGNFQSLAAHIASWIWQGLLFVLSLVLTLLGWAFSLNPFSDGGVMREISGSLERFYRVFTSPWLVLAFVCVGAWGVYKGLIRREVGASVAGMAVAVALMTVGLIVLHEPKATVGTAANYVDDAATALIAAPLSGSLSEPKASYAAATAETWNAMTLPGFAALNFSDVGWALSKPAPELLEFADEYACADWAYIGAIPAEEQEAVLKEWVSSDNAEIDCHEVEGLDSAMIPKPETNAEIWLRNSTGAPARYELWDEFGEDSIYSKYLSTQGGGGAWTRLPLVIVIALGLLGGILLLSYLAIRLLMAAAVGFIMLLAAPLALFLPAFGERGRASFVLWATTLLGALLSKLVYSALLAIVLAATSVATKLAGDGGDGLGTMAAFLVSSGLWWAAFIKRESILAFLQVGGDREDGGFLRNAMGLYAATRLGKQALGVAGAPVRGAARGGRAGLSGFIGQAGDRDTGSEAMAEGELDERAGERLDQKYEGAKERLGEHDKREEGLSELNGQAETKKKELAALSANAPGQGAHPRAKANHARKVQKAEGELAGIQARQARQERLIANHDEQAKQDRALVSAADRSEAASGQRWSRERVTAERNELREELGRPASDGAHAWRAGMSPAEYTSLRGARREQVHGEVAEHLRRDRAALGTVADRPPGAIGKAPKRRAAKDLRRATGQRKRDVVQTAVGSPQGKSDEADERARASYRGGREENRVERRDEAERMGRRSLSRRPRRPSRRGVGGR